MIPNKIIIDRMTRHLVGYIDPYGTRISNEIDYERFRSEVEKAYYKAIEDHESDLFFEYIERKAINGIHK